MSDLQLVTPAKEQQPSPEQIFYVLDTNVLLHDPGSILNFEEHHVVIPITVLEELDSLKRGRQAFAADCRQAIRELDRQLGRSGPDVIENGVPIRKLDDSFNGGSLSILMTHAPDDCRLLPANSNDNRILNDVGYLKQRHPDRQVILVSKDITVRLKARGCGIQCQDYHSDQLLSGIEQLHKGYLEYSGTFWDRVEQVETEQRDGHTFHKLHRKIFGKEIYPNQFIVDEAGFLGRVTSIGKEHACLRHIDRERLMEQETWGLRPRDVYQAMALDLLLDPEVHMASLTGSAGSGKTILALAAAIEQTVPSMMYRRIIVTRSAQGLDEDIGYLPGTEEEKMKPWLGSITDNLEALHWDDENCAGSIDYVLEKVPLLFKSLNYIRGRSFQSSLIIIDECQNLTPHQVKTIVTRAGNGSKVVCLGNLAQIDTPYLNATSSGLTYLTERFKYFEGGGNVLLQGVPRSALACYAEQHL